MEKAKVSILFLAAITLLSWAWAENTNNSSPDLTATAPAAPVPFHQQVEAPQVRNSFAYQLKGQRLCRFRTMLFNLGRRATQQDRGPVYPLNWIGVPTRAYAINKPRLYNHIEIHIECQQPLPSTGFQTIPGATDSVTFPTLNQHREFPSPEEERLYLQRVRDQVYQQLQNMGVEWNANNAANCGLAPMQATRQDPVTTPPACQFTPGAQ